MIFTFLYIINIYIIKINASKDVLLPKGTVVTVDKGTTFRLCHEFKDITKEYRQLSYQEKIKKIGKIPQIIDISNVMVDISAFTKKVFEIKTYAHFGVKVFFTVGDKKYSYTPKEEFFKSFADVKNAFYFDFESNCKYTAFNKNGVDKKHFCFPIVEKKNFFTNKDAFYFDDFKSIFEKKNKNSEVATDFTIDSNKLCKLEFIKKKSMYEINHGKKVSKTEYRDFLRNKYKCILLKNEFLEELLNTKDPCAFQSIMNFCENKQQVKLLNDCYVTEENKTNKVNTHNTHGGKKGTVFAVIFVSMVVMSCVGLVADRKSVV